MNHWRKPEPRKKDWRDGLGQKFYIFWIVLSLLVAVRLGVLFIYGE